MRGFHAPAPRRRREALGEIGEQNFRFRFEHVRRIDDEHAAADQGQGIMRAEPGRPLEQKLEALTTPFGELGHAAEKNRRLRRVP